MTLEGLFISNAGLITCILVAAPAGCAIETIDEEEAVKTLEIIKELSENEIC